MQHSQQRRQATLNHLRRLAKRGAVAARPERSPTVLLRRTELTQLFRGVKDDVSGGGDDGGAAEDPIRLDPGGGF